MTSRRDNPDQWVLAVAVALLMCAIVAAVLMTTGCDTVDTGLVQEWVDAAIEHNAESAEPTPRPPPLPSEPDEPIPNEPPEEPETEPTPDLGPQYVRGPQYVIGRQGWRHDSIGAFIAHHELEPKGYQNDVSPARPAWSARGFPPPFVIEFRRADGMPVETLDVR